MQNILTALKMMVLQTAHPVMLMFECIIKPYSNTRHKEQRHQPQLAVQKCLSSHSHPIMVGKHQDPIPKTVLYNNGH